MIYINASNHNQSLDLPLVEGEACILQTYEMHCHGNRSLVPECFVLNTSFLLSMSLPQIIHSSHVTKTCRLLLATCMYTTFSSFEVHETYQT